MKAKMLRIECIAVEFPFIFRYLYCIVILQYIYIYLFLNHKTRSNQHLKHCSARYLHFGVKYGGQKYCRHQSDRNLMVCWVWGAKKFISSWIRILGRVQPISFLLTCGSIFVGCKILRQFSKVFTYPSTWKSDTRKSSNLHQCWTTVLFYIFPYSWMLINLFQSEIGTKEF